MFWASQRLDLWGQHPVDLERQKEKTNGKTGKQKKFRCY